MSACTSQMSFRRRFSVGALLVFSLVLILGIGPIAAYAEFLATGVAPRRIADAGPVACLALFPTCALVVVCVLRAMWWIESADAAARDSDRSCAHRASSLPDRLP